jgi:predicted MFS family arabinose efflux permease
VLRALTGVTLVSTFGDGLFYITSALFFTRSVGMTPAQLGLGLAIAGVCGVTAGPPLGSLADHWDARRVLMAALAAEGIAMPGHTRVHSFAAFLPLACLITFLDRGGTGVRNALAGTALGPAERTYGRACLRAVTNVGIGAGAALAAAALQSGTRTGYLVVVIADAATFLAAAALLVPLRAPGMSGAPGPAGPDPGAPGAATRTTGPAGLVAGQAADGKPAPRSALTGLLYLLITILNGLLSLQLGLLQVGLPLWVVRSTHAPRLTISAVLVLNTAMVALWQVRASRGTQDPQRAARICRRAGLLLAVACAAYGYTHGVPAPAAAVMLLFGAITQTIAEMLSSAAGSALSYDLADQTAHSVYQGIFNSGITAGMLLAPLVITSTAIRFGAPGWLALGAVFALAGAALVPATRWALSQRNAPVLKPAIGPPSQAPMLPETAVTPGGTAGAHR